MRDAMYVAAGVAIRESSQAAGLMLQRAQQAF
jgi:hypothetical protein